LNAEPQFPLVPLVYAITLGCPKNRVDTEVMLGDLLSHGYVLTADPREADVLLVNTCGFLREARDESIETLKEVARDMRPGSRLVAAGCMTEVFRREIAEAVPEADLFLGTRELLRLRGLLEGSTERNRAMPSAANPRLVTTGDRLAYLKVADGCSRRCSFCLIPRLKGRQHSRTPDDILAEAGDLAAVGVREVVLVAQDLVHYGADLPGRPGLASLVRRLAREVPTFRWIRLMYLYPRDLDDELLEVVSSHDNVLPYLDLPVQHADDRVLAAMRRGTSRRSLEALVDRVRRQVPGAVLRTTYMVGFPGETREAFEGLLSFARRARFEMAGVFLFSPEPGSRAAELPGQVAKATRERRRKRLQTVLDTVAADMFQAVNGQVHEALVESSGGRGAVGRLWFQAPEVDGVLRLSRCEAPEGEFVDVRITGIRHGDYLGEEA